MEKSNSSLPTVIIADAGPIIHLDELNCLDILAGLGEIILPEIVWNEIKNHRPQALENSDLKMVKRHIQHYSPLVDALIPFYSLHAGEREALHLCLEFKKTLLLTDDTAARLAAKNLNIKVHGTLGLLVRAIHQQSRTKAEVLKLLRDIPLQSSLHIRPSLLFEVIEEVEKNAN